MNNITSSEYHAVLKYGPIIKYKRTAYDKTYHLSNYRSAFHTSKTNIIVIHEN